MRTAVLTWTPGDEIPLGRRTLRVVAIRDDDADQPPALVVETLARMVTLRRTETGPRLESCEHLLARIREAD